MTRAIYSFPEPEKTTAWKDQDAPQIELRDFEADDARQRTEQIKKRMSSPGALGLPPLLEAQRFKYGIPDGAFRAVAGFDRVFIFPIDLFDDEETYGGTSIIRPKLTKLKDTAETHRGVLISAGLGAADRLMSHGYELGHIVATMKNVPTVRRVERFDKFEIFIFVMRDGDLAGNETLGDEIRAGKKRIVDIGGDGQYEHQIARIGDDGSVDVSKKKSVYISDTW